MKTRSLLVLSEDENGELFYKRKRFTAAEISRARRAVRASRSKLVAAVYRYGGYRIGNLLAPVSAGDTLAYLEEVARAADETRYPRDYPVKP